MMDDIIHQHNHKPSLDELQRLERELEDWGIEGDYDALDAWYIFETKNIMPFSGGYFEQPAWIKRAFKQLNKVFNYRYYTRNHFQAPTPKEQEKSNPFARFFKKKDDS